MNVSAFWSILPEQLQAVASLIQARLATGDPRAYTAAAPSAPQRAGAGGAVAVIPIRGVLVQHSSDLWYGDTSTDWIQKAVTEMANNSQVGAIVLDIDSPGGIVFGTEETADTIRAVRKRKPVYAIANSMAASAAYWIASAASKLYMTPGGQVGSIGVWNMHVDVSKMEENLGLKTTLISAGRYKVEGSPWGPLGDEARDKMQGDVNTYYERFIRGVAAGRRVSPSTVRDKFGQGRLVLSAMAEAVGMVDGVMSYEELARDPNLTRRDRDLDRQLAAAAAWKPPRQRRAEVLLNLALAQAEGAK